MSHLGSPLVEVPEALPVAGIIWKEWCPLLPRVLGLSEDAVPHLVGVLHVYLHKNFTIARKLVCKQVGRVIRRWIGGWRLGGGRVASYVST